MIEKMKNKNTHKDLPCQNKLNFSCVFLINILVIASEILSRHDKKAWKIDAIIRKYKVL